MKESKTKSVADRLRAKLSNDPEAKERLRQALLDICECGGSDKHGEHFGDCPKVDDPNAVPWAAWRGLLDPNGPVDPEPCMSSACRYAKRSGMSVGNCTCDKCPWCGATIRPHHGEHRQWCTAEGWEPRWKREAPPRPTTQRGGTDGD